MSTGHDTDMRLRLELAGVPESVALVRSLIGSVGAGAGLDPELIDDMRTAISEACNNVVLHAYPDASGPLIFSLTRSGTQLEATVRDQGPGIRPGLSRNRGLGMGVTLINSLAERAEFRSSEFGTEVRMRFRCPVTADSGSQVSLEDWALTDPRSSDALQGQSD